MVEMKKKFMVMIVIMLIFTAVCLFYRQPELYNVNVNEQIYEIYLKNNNLYLKEMLPVKLTNEEILDFKIYDIDFDKNDELLVITKNHDDEYGRNLIIYNTETDNNLKLYEIFREDFSDIKPWKIDACNLDNDGETDIFLGVFKDTMFYKDFRKRPFFYSWDGEKLNKKWLGSYFTDWELVDISFGDYFNVGYDVAAVLEKSKDGEYRVGIYKFIGFGFEHMKTINIDDKSEWKNLENLLNHGIKNPAFAGFLCLIFLLPIVNLLVS